MDPRAPTLRRRLLAELVRGASAAIEVGRGFFVVKIRSGEFFAASPARPLKRSDVIVTKALNRVDWRSSA
jgi:hypothetical protein